MKQTKKHDKLKAQSRQRWPKFTAERIKLIKQAKIRFDARKPKKRATRPLRKKPLRQKLNEDVLADELINSINKQDVEKVKETLDKLWRKNIQTGKDINVIKAAQKFLREVDSNNS